MINNAEISTWQGQEELYRSKGFKGTKNCCLGMIPMWEYQMLVNAGAITENAIKEDGFTVRDYKDNLLYSSNNKSSAMDAKSNSKGSIMSTGSYMYSSYCDYKDYLAFKERQCNH